VWADTETDVDFLNYSEVAELVAELIANADLLSLSLGIFGGWGVGKSSTLRLVEAELKKTAEHSTLRQCRLGSRSTGNKHRRPLPSVSPASYAPRD
jgi:KAP family P-loop domain